MYSSKSVTETLECSEDRESRHVDAITSYAHECETLESHPLNGLTIAHAVSDPCSIAREHAHSRRPFVDNVFLRQVRDVVTFALPFVVFFHTLLEWGFRGVVTVGLAETTSLSTAAIALVSSILYGVRSLEVHLDIVTIHRCMAHSDLCVFIAFPLFAGGEGIGIARAHPFGMEPRSCAVEWCFTILHFTGCTHVSWRSFCMLRFHSRFDCAMDTTGGLIPHCVGSCAWCLLFDMPVLVLRAAQGEAGQTA